MPTKLPRFSVTFPVPLYNTIKRDAELYERSESGQVVWALKQYYSSMKKQAEVFTSPQLRATKRAPVPVFETPDPQALEPALKRRANSDRGKS